MNVNLSELMALDRDELVAIGQNVFGHPAPERCREGNFLRQALGWKLQSDAHGKLSGNELRSLRERSSSTLAVGSHLIRVWRGETHQVTVLDEDLPIQVETGKALAQSPVPSLERMVRARFFLGLKNDYETYSKTVFPYLRHLHPQIFG